LLNIRRCTQEKWIDSIKLKIPLVQTHHLLLRNELLGEKKTLFLQTGSVSVATQISLNLSGILTDWNVIMVLSSVCPQENKEFAQEMNLVSVILVVPLVILYLAFSVTENMLVHLSYIQCGYILWKHF
jgi:hypothetical protein